MKTNTEREENIKCYNVIENMKQCHKNDIKITLASWLI